MRHERPTVYIPNLDGGARLLAALASLREQSLRAEVVVVDNGSSDGSAHEAKLAFPEITLVELPDNVGFGRALNAATAQVRGDPLIFVNNDVECSVDFVAALLGELAAGIDMVAGVLLQRDATHLIDSAGVIVDATAMAFDYLHGQPLRDASTAPAPCGPTGAAALFRRAAFEAVGGFDERIFAYYEDADLALRLRGRGARCRLAAHAQATHHYSATLGASASRKYELTGWSRAYMLRRYSPLDPALALRALACEGAICAGQLLVDHTAAGAHGRLAGWRAARGLPRRVIPAEGVSELSIVDTLRLRAGRRGLRAPAGVRKRRSLAARERSSA